MVNLFKKYPIYIQLWFNKVAVTNLLSGEVLAKESLKPFSNSRIVLANPWEAELIISEVIKEIGYPKRFLSYNFIACIQQMEILTDGLSEAEKVIMRHIAEQVCCLDYEILEHNNPLTIEEALAILKQ